MQKNFSRYTSTPSHWSWPVLLPSVLYWYLHSEENSEAELIGFLLAVAGLDGALHRQDSPVLHVLFKKKNNW
jgi:hypothetical protein